jgi:hypothetical protein
MPPMKCLVPRKKTLGRVPWDAEVREIIERIKKGEGSAAGCCDSLRCHADGFVAPGAFQIVGADGAGAEGVEVFILEVEFYFCHGLVVVCYGLVRKKRKIAP